MKENKSNKELIDQHLKLQAIQRTYTDVWQRDASRFLSLRSYKLFQSQVAESYDYVAQKVGDVIKVKRGNNNDAPARVLKMRGAVVNKDYACSCPYTIAHCLPCKHEICERRFLKQELFRNEVDTILIPQRHKQRSALTISFNTGTYKNDYSSFKNLPFIDSIQRKDRLPLLSDGKTVERDDDDDDDETGLINNDDDASDTHNVDVKKKSNEDDSSS
jgi:hypothetical protein